LNIFKSNTTVYCFLYLKICRDHLLETGWRKICSTNKNRISKSSSATGYWLFWHRNQH